jgi:endonuclease/exonuclease/phosphatase family metal-dependent hydrolase
MDPAASIFDAPGIKVMSQNLYLGANLDLLLQGDLTTAFNQLLTSNAGGFGRAQQLAWQIVQEEPHFVGLQEVTRYTFDTPAGTDVMDYLTILQAYLAYFTSVGATDHTWTAFRNDLTSVGPLDLSPLPVMVTYLDADAILVRDDVELVGEPTLVDYDASEILYLGPTMPIEFLRGYVAVTGTAEGHTIRFANTHLEVQRFEETQLAQVGQLIDELGESPVPVVLVGDFNSAANHDAAPTEETATYKTLRRAGYADLWLRERGSVAGYTCCQAPDLTNPVSELSQRLDLVLVRYGNAGFGGQSMMEIVGEEVSDRITVEDGTVGTVTLWPSDHAGVVGTFWPAPGHRFE